MNMIKSIIVLVFIRKTWSGTLLTGSWGDGSLLLLPLRSNHKYVRSFKTLAVSAGIYQFSMYVCIQTHFGRDNLAFDLPRKHYYSIEMLDKIACESFGTAVIILWSMLAALAMSGAI